MSGVNGIISLMILLLHFQLTPWNIDTICHEGFEKTIINVPKKKQEEHLTEEEREKRMRNFVKKYEKELKHYGTLQKFEDSKRYLQDRLHLVCEDTANYLVFWCINLEMEEVCLLSLVLI